MCLAQFSLGSCCLTLCLSSVIPSAACSGLDNSITICDIAQLSLIPHKQLDWFVHHIHN